MLTVVCLQILIGVYSILSCNRHCLSSRVVNPCRRDNIGLKYFHIFNATKTSDIISTELQPPELEGRPSPEYIL